MAGRPVPVELFDDDPTWSALDELARTPLPPTDRHRDPMTAARIHTCGRVKSLMEGAPIARSRPRVCRGLYSSKPVPGPVKMSSCP